MPRAVIHDVVINIEDNSMSWNISTIGINGSAIREDCNKGDRCNITCVSHVTHPPGLKRSYGRRGLPGK